MVCRLLFFYAERLRLFKPPEPEANHKLQTTNYKPLLLLLLLYHLHIPAIRIVIRLITTISNGMGR
jgi:hypothetical protein